MSSETTLTGRRGFVVLSDMAVYHVTEWSVNPTMATSSEWGDSTVTNNLHNNINYNAETELGGSSDFSVVDPRGYTYRAAGRRDATFDLEGKYDGDMGRQWNLFQPGDTTLAILYLSTSHYGNTQGVQMAGNIYWSFPRALCDDFSLTVDIDSEEVVGWEASFGADGEYFRPRQAGQESYPLIEEREYVDERDVPGIWESSP